jgi:diguanylate cyclase (GGDEF)-like protein
VLADEISAAILTIEDGVLSDVLETRDAAARLEQEALALGDELLVQRARLCGVTMLMRTGELAAAARQIWSIHRWAEDHREPRLLARLHLTWSNIHQFLGDPAQSLEHALKAVELLDATATPYMEIYHRLKLADALGAMGSMDAARARYRQTEEFCHRLDRPDLLLWLLNNWAWTEAAAGETARAERIAQRLRDQTTEQGIELPPNVLDTIGGIEIQSGRFIDAERTLLTCIQRYGDGRMEDADSLAEYLLTLARAQRGVGATDRAQATLDRSRAVCAERDLGHTLVRVHQEQAELYAARGDFEAAFAEYKVFHAAQNRLVTADREAQARTRQAMFETAEAREEAERFREQARRDPLTGLLNRRYVDEQLPGLIQRDPLLTLAIVDLDHFKQINDRLSHDVGDQVLVQVSRILESSLAAICPDGFAARMGGEEFLMVLPGTEVATAARLLDEIRATVGAHAWQPVVGDLPVTISIGVATRAQASSPTQPALLSAADRNLYAAKHAGRDRVVFGGNRSYRDAA